MAKPTLRLPPPFEEAIRPHERELMRFVMRMSRNREDARDLFQETCLRAYRAYPRLERIEGIRSWLFRIAGNLCRNHARDSTRRARVIVSVDDDYTERATSRSDGSQQLADIRKLVTRLPPKQQQALTMRKFDGRGYEEIAQALGCSVQSARANVSQALRKLKANWS